jgi:peptidoglycan/xylan/chitin deacetylase (PgdA/CDA1 family)/PKD repeat protein
MKNTVLSLVFFSLQITVFSQNYRISPWFEDKGSAICPTFDDGTPDHPANVVPLLNEFGVQGTFYVNASNNYSWHISALADGHEIGNHTKDHPHLLTLDSLELKEQIGDFKKTLYSQTGSSALTFAYPFGEGSETQESSFIVQDSVANHHIAGRGVYSYLITGFPYNFASKERDYYQIPTLAVTAENLYSMMDWCMTEGGLLPLMYHGVGAPGVFDNIPVQEFREHLEYLTGKGDSVWVTSLANAVSYHRERKGAQLTEISAPFALEDKWTLRLTDTVRDDWYYFPLSIVLEIPESITAITGIAQNEKNIEYRVEGDTIYFNAVPDGGDILIDILDCEQASGALTISGETSFCQPDSVLFEFPYNAEYQYTWFKDSESFGSDTNRISVSEPGSYYGLIEWNGCPLTTEKTRIEVTGTCGVPNTAFTVNKTSQFKDAPVIFTSTSTNLSGEEKYFWNFGEGASLSPGYYGEGPIEVSYSISGFKSVSLTVEGSIGDSTIQKPNLVEIEDFSPCHAFLDDFNDGINSNFFAGWHNYSLSAKNNALRIKTASTGHQWYLVDYAFNDGKNETIIDFSDPLVEPVLKMRIKASDTCRVAIFLVDENGVATVGSTMNSVAGLDVTSEYQTFTMDISGLFFQQWEGKDVDSSKIKTLRIAVNPGYTDYPFVNQYGTPINSHFVGTIDIDWISLGRDCEPEPYIGNIVLPEKACLGESVILKATSDIDLSEATVTWDFGNDNEDFQIVKSSKEEVEVLFNSVSSKTATLTIETNENIYSFEDNFSVTECAVGLLEPMGFEFKMQNPIQNSIMGEINCPFAVSGLLEVYDPKGILVLNRDLHLENGNNLFSLNPIDLDSGIYKIVFSKEVGYISKLLLKL